MIRILHILCLLCLHPFTIPAAVINGTAPQTQVQREVSTAAREAATSASEAALTSTLELFGASATNKYLAQFDDGTGLQYLSADELSTRFWDELASAELVHNFGNADAAANCGYDVTLDIGEQASFFENQWEIQSRGQIPVDPAQNIFSEASETKLFGFPPFANTSAPDLKTAADRPLYAAVNMYRGSGGNPQCGSIGAVFSRSYIGDAAVLTTPIDTGLFEGSCSGGEGVGYLGPTPCLVCGAWPEESGRPLGSPPYLNHMLGPFLAFFNATQAVADDEYPNYNLARLLTRLLSRKTYQQNPSNSRRGIEVATGSSSGGGGGGELQQQDNGSVALALTFLENCLGYFESNPAASVSLGHPSSSAAVAAAAGSTSVAPTTTASPASTSSLSSRGSSSDGGGDGGGGGGGGIKMMIGMFELLFGTDEGQRLRNWCVAKGWPLAWAYNPTMSFFRCGPDGQYPGCTLPASLVAGLDTASVRVLDPVVLPSVPCGHNASTKDLLDPRAVATFEFAWASTNASALSPADLEAAWNSLFYGGAGDTGVFTALAIEPVFFGACGDEACVGVSVDSQRCVCPPT